MATAEFYVLLEPTFANKERTKVKKVQAASIRQTRPDPSTQGLWISASIEVPDVVFGQLMPRLEAKISAAQMEAMLMETSELFVKVVGLDDEGGD